MLASEASGMGVRIGAPSFLIKNTMNFAGLVLLALRLTV
jgi:hypothetical protein